jgi:hypothetical protein
MRGRTAARVPSLLAKNVAVVDADVWILVLTVLHA